MPGHGLRWQGPGRTFSPKIQGDAVSLHPADLALLQLRLGEEPLFPERTNVLVRCEASLPRGDCRAEGLDTSVLSELGVQLAALRQRDPSTGLNDYPEIVAFLRLVTSTESLAARLTRYTERGIAALAEALRESDFDPLVARLAAAQIIVVQRELAIMNHERLVSGEAASGRYPEAVRAANHAFDLLKQGLEFRRPQPKPRGSGTGRSSSERIELMFWRTK